jgi:hypothetical protein
MDDQGIQNQIEKLIDEEQGLLRSSEGKGLDQERHARLEEVKVNLDRCWDLLRQRRAREEFGQDPDRVQARDSDTVERYLQ